MKAAAGSPTSETRLKRNDEVTAINGTRPAEWSVAEKLDWVTVINADVINSDALQEERVDQSDAFVAATDDEETNILAAALAKTRGATMPVTSAAFSMAVLMSC